MSSKGWVSRKREQFEQFARTQDESENRDQAQTQAQAQVQVQTYKPTKDGEMKVKIVSR